MAIPPWLQTSRPLALRWRKRCTALSLAVFTGLVALGGMAIALTPEEVAAKLDTVPLFGLIDSAGNAAPLQLRDREGKSLTVARWFLDPADAEAFLARAIAADPSAKDRLKVGLLSLGDAYRLLLQPPGEVAVQLVPDRQEVAAAREVLDLYKQPQERLQGIPLFLITVSDDGGASLGEQAGRSYLTAVRDGKEEIRFFMDREQAIAAVRALQQQDAKLAESARLEIVDLEEFTKVLTEQNDLWLDRILVVPSIEAQEFLQKNAPPASPPPR